MRSLSSPSARKVDESWKKNNAKIFEEKRSNDNSQRYSQEWMRKNVFLNVNIVDYCIEDGFHMASHV